MNQHTNGLIAALFTPLKENGDINYEMLPDLIDYLVEIGLKGVFICGSNGEGPNLTLEERQRVTEIILENNKGRLTTIVHVGHASIAESRKLAKHAAAHGANAISSVAAFYFKPTSVQNLVDCMTEIATASPELPFYYYHIPTLTGINIDTVDFMQRAEKQIPNFKGIKYTAATTWEYMSCLNYKNGKYDVMYGFDENHLAALAVGATGCIGSTFCFSAPLYLSVREQFEKGNMIEARKQMLYLVEMVRVVVKYPPIPAQKAVMKMLGFDMGPCRNPLQILTDEQYNTLYNELVEIDFFNQPGIVHRNA
jgi:N-acetylneuraminate lyase